MAQEPPETVEISAGELSRAAAIDFAVNREDELPVGTQLDWRLRAMLVRGALRPGDRLPSVRELAGFAGVNVNTARSVYERLEREGLIVAEHGRGTFVTAAAEELAQAGSAAEEAVDRAARDGIDPRLLAATIYSASGASAPPRDPADELELRRALREQISSLERELAAHAWEDPREPPPRRPATAEPTAHVAGVEELERIRAGLIDRLRELRAAAEDRSRAESAARTRIGEMVDDPRAHRWEIVSAEEAGEPSGGEWQVVPRLGPVGAILGWWRVRAR